MKLTDNMANADPVQVARSAMTCLDRLQDFAPAEQVMGAAALFLCLAEHLNVPAQDVFTYTKNLMLGADGKRSEFRAITDYCANEL